jgi:hypothetical protein
MALEVDATELATRIESGDVFNIEREIKRRLKRAM